MLQGGYMLLRLSLSTYVCILLLIFPATTALAEDDPLLARAGGYEFRMSDLQQFLDYVPPLLKLQIESNPEQLVFFVHHIMKQRIVADIAMKEGFDKDKDIQKQIKFITDDFIAKAYIVSAVVEKTTVSDAEAKEYYELNKDKFTTPKQAKVSHILIKVALGSTLEEKRKAKEKANQMLDWLKKGDKFESLAERYSDDDKTKTKGGRLGYIQMGMMPKNFDEKAFSMKPGQISDIVETDLGFHIIQVEDIRDASIKPFEKEKASIIEQLKVERGQKRAEEFIRNAEKEAGLVVFPDKIKRAYSKQ